MSDYNVGDVFYLPSYYDEICTLEEKRMDGTLVFSNGKGGICTFKGHVLRSAFPATLENYEKLSQLWPDLEKPPKQEREDVDVTGFVMFSDSEHQDYRPTSFPSVCWVKNELDTYSTIAVITKMEAIGYYTDSLNEEWDCAIPLTQGELEQLKQLNGDKK